MNFGEHLPEWIIAAVAVYGAYQSWRNRARVAETHELVQKVQEQTNGMSQRLESIARSEGRAEGVAETQAAEQVTRK